MTRVRIRWTETATYDQWFEIENFNPDAEDVDEVLEGAILQDANWSEVDGVTERDIDGFKLDEDEERDDESSSNPG
jgi:hypothetical protein